MFESDFGFVLNCAFKKSGLFRVRNLGGVKGYVGLGKKRTYEYKTCDIEFIMVSYIISVTPSSTNTVCTGLF